MKTFIPKRLPTPQPMHAAEREYLRNLIRYQNAYQQLLESGINDIVHGLKTIATEEMPEEIRQDSLYKTLQNVTHFDENIEKSIRILFESVQNRLKKLFPDSLLAKWSQAMVSHVNDISKKNIKRTASAADIEIEPLLRDKELTPYFKNVVDENVGLIRSIPQSKMTSLKNALVFAITNDHPQDQIREMLQKNFGATRNQAKLIAVDQTNKLNGKIAQYRQQQIGGKRYRWRASMDERTTGNPSGKYPDAKPSHWNRDGKIYYWDNPPEGGHPGQRVRCLPGDTQIRINQPINKLFRRWHTGKMTLLVSGSGEIIRLTSNHPVLTHRGWMPSQQVQIGDYLIDTFDHGFNRLNINDEQMQTSIENLFSTFNTPDFFIQKSTSIQTDFHGDGGIDQEIYIIDIQRSLRHDLEASLKEKFTKFFFSFPNMTSSFFKSSSFQSGFFMTCLSQLASLFSSQSTHSQEIRLASISSLNSLLIQTNTNRTSRDFIFSGNGQDAHSIQIIFNEFLRQILTIPWFLTMLNYNTPSSELLAEISRSSFQSTSNLFEKDTLGIKFNCVIDKSISEFNGHVYNLETPSHWYIANNRAVHNCRCTAEMILEDIVD